MIADRVANNRGRRRRQTESIHHGESAPPPEEEKKTRKMPTSIDNRRRRTICKLDRSSTHAILNRRSCRRHQYQSDGLMARFASTNLPIHILEMASRRPKKREKKKKRNDDDTHHEDNWNQRPEDVARGHSARPAGDSGTKDDRRRRWMRPRPRPLFVERTNECEAPNSTISNNSTKKKSSLANGNQFQVSLAAILMFSDGNGPDWILISTFRHPARAGSFDQIIGLISEPPPPKKKRKKFFPSPSSIPFD